MANLHYNIKIKMAVIVNMVYLSSFGIYVDFSVKVVSVLCLQGLCADVRSTMMIERQKLVSLLNVCVVTNM